jgi:phosphoesterase RecJ-like protein
MAPLLEALDAAETILLTGHVRPDGDCLGAQAALHGVLTSLGKRVYILNPDPPAPEFAYLEEACPFGSWDGGDLPAHDLLVLLDVGELGRCGALGERLAAAPSKKAVIDHHIPVREPWWDVAYLDRTASATGLLVARVADALGVDLTGGMALGVFTSLVTDCGWFRYGNTDSETLVLAARLVEGGLEPDVMYGLIYQRKPEEHPRAVGEALLATSFHGNGRLALAEVPCPAPGQASSLDGDDVLDLLRSVANVEVVLLLRDQGNGTCRLSARSKSWFDVQQLTAAVGGGGHARAAGATLDGSLEDVGKRLLELALRQLDGAEGEPDE